MGNERFVQKMRSAARSALSRAAKLDPANAYAGSPKCKVCGGICSVFDVLDFNKFREPGDFYRFGLAGVDVLYWRCASCGLPFTNFFDGWTRDDFRQLIYNDQYMKVDPDYFLIRPLRLAAKLADGLRGYERSRILNYGSGSRVLLEQMRALGYNQIEAYDPFSSPSHPTGRFDIIICADLIEHSIDPLSTFADAVSLLAEDGCIIFSQTVQPPDLLKLRGSWWYLAPRNGHVSTYGEETLVTIAGRFDMTLHRGSTVYAMVRPRTSQFKQSIARIIGPEFAVLRLFAPARLPRQPICFPTTSSIWWYEVVEESLFRYRWTGIGQVIWRAHWPEVSVLQVRIPAVQEAWPGLRESCTIQLDGSRQRARLDRDEMIAEFDVAGTQSGLIELHIPPPPSDGPAHEASAQPRNRQPHGLAILTNFEPVRPATQPALMPLAQEQ